MKVVILRDTEVEVCDFTYDDMGEIIDEDKAWSKQTFHKDKTITAGKLYDWDIIDDILIINNGDYEFRFKIADIYFPYAYKNIIQEGQVSQGRQSSNYKEILQLQFDNKIKISIKRDSFDFQSYAKVHVWKDLEWSLIDYIPYSEMNTCKDIHLKGKHKFMVDRFELLKIANLIIAPL